MDHLTLEQRSWNMAQIKGRNTKPALTAIFTMPANPWRNEIMFRGKKGAIVADFKNRTLIPPGKDPEYDAKRGMVTNDNGANPAASMKNQYRKGWSLNG